MKVPFSYLPRQFDNPDPLLEALRPVVRAGDFTLGPRVEAFEKRFAELHTPEGQEPPYSIGVGSGTDALALALEALGIGPGDEVITSPSTFVATAGAIDMVGAKPVFVDIDDRYLMDLDLIEKAITPATRAIMPVHYTGDMVDMRALRGIADHYGLLVIEDACQAVLASFDGAPPGTWSHAAAFSLHPLKNLHVWGDGGVVLTRDENVDRFIRLQRNHGLVNRDEVAVFGRNSRLHTLQAAVGSLLIEGADDDTDARVAVARRYDEALAHLPPHIRVPPRDDRVRHVYHLYVLQVEQRDEVLAFLANRGVEAKVHYPIPVHLQEAAKGLGYQRGDFPRAEAYSQHALTLPANPYLHDEEIAYVIQVLEDAVESLTQAPSSLPREAAAPDASPVGR